MFMGNENGFQCIRRYIQHRKTTLDLLGGETAVNQNPASFRFDQMGITLAAAAERRAELSPEDLRDEFLDWFLHGMVQTD